MGGGSGFGGGNRRPVEMGVTEQHCCVCIPTGIHCYRPVGALLEMQRCYYTTAVAVVVDAVVVAVDAVAVVGAAVVVVVVVVGFEKGGYKGS